MISLWGCSREEHKEAIVFHSGNKTPGIYLGEKECSMSELSPGSVVLVVNGEKYTKRDFTVAQTMYDKIRRLRAKDSLTGPNSQAENAVRISNNRTISEILRRALIRQYGKKFNIEPPNELVDEYAKKAATAMRQPDKSLNEIAEMFGGPEGNLLLEYNRVDALNEQLRHHFDKEHFLTPSNEHVMQVSNRWLKARFESVQSNAVQKAILEKALVEIRSGTNFIEVAKKYSSTPDDAKEWDDFLLEEFEESPQVAQWLKTAKDGDVSGILEMDDGWSVIKVLSRHSEEVPPEDVIIPRTMWLLVRITRPLYETAADLTHKQIVQMLISYHSRRLQKEVGDAIMADAVIEWPYGTNLFPKVENKTDVK